LSINFFSQTSLSVSELTALTQALTLITLGLVNSLSNLGNSPEQASALQPLLLRLNIAPMYLPRLNITKRKAPEDGETSQAKHPKVGEP